MNEIFSQEDLPERFFIKVVPNAKGAKIVKEAITGDKHSYKVFVTQPACDNKANEAALVLLAKYFRVKKSCLRLIAGLKSRSKIVQLLKES